MSTNLKNRLAEVIKWLFKGKNKFVIFIFLIIFFVFFIGKLDRIIVWVWTLKNKPVADILLFKNKEITDNNQGDGFLGGPTTIDDSSFSAEAAVDLSADDEVENMSYRLIDGDSIITSANPSVIDQFLGFKKDISYYIVQKSDTPEKIAVDFDINTTTLLWANNLRNGDLIRPGDKLMILPINGVRAQIKKGDTIEGLAKKYQAKADEITQFNSLASDNDLKIGDYVIIPDGEMPAAVKIVQPKVTAPKFVYVAPTGSSWMIIPTSGYNWGRLHSFNGVDIANKCGTPIYAAAAGKVVTVDVVGWNGGYGKNVRIQHPNGVITLYAHLSQALVLPGEEVAQGQLIALMGTTGRSTGCHIHFEVRGAKNPFAWK